MDKLQIHCEKFQEHARELLGLETSLKAIIPENKKLGSYDYQDAFCYTVANFVHYAADSWTIPEISKPDNGYSQADKEYKLQGLDNTLVSYIAKIDALTWLASYETERKLFYKEPCRLASRATKIMNTMRNDLQYIKEKLCASSSTG